MTLTAEISYEDTAATKEFTFSVYSEAAVKAELADKQKRLKTALEAVRRYGALKPVYGRDTNIVTMLADRFAAVGEPVSITVSSVETLHEGASIDRDGTITYFFADPNTTPSLHSGSLLRDFRHCT